MELAVVAAVSWSDQTELLAVRLKGSLSPLPLVCQHLCLHQHGCCAADSSNSRGSIITSALTLPSPRGRGQSRRLTLKAVGEMEPWFRQSSFQPPSVFALARLREPKRSAGSQPKAARRANAVRQRGRGEGKGMAPLTPRKPGWRWCWAGPPPHPCTPPWPCTPAPPARWAWRGGAGPCRGTKNPAPAWSTAIPPRAGCKG